MGTIMCAFVLVQVVYLEVRIITRGCVFFAFLGRANYGGLVICGSRASATVLYQLMISVDSFLKW